MATAFEGENLDFFEDVEANARIRQNECLALLRSMRSGTIVGRDLERVDFLRVLALCDNSMSYDIIMTLLVELASAVAPGSCAIFAASLNKVIIAWASMLYIEIWAVIQQYLPHPHTHTHSASAVELGAVTPLPLVPLGDDLTQLYSNLWTLFRSCEQLALLEVPPHSHSVPTGFFKSKRSVKALQIQGAIQDENLDHVTQLPSHLVGCEYDLLHVPTTALQGWRNLYDIRGRLRVLRRAVQLKSDQERQYRHQHTLDDGSVSGPAVYATVQRLRVVDEDFDMKMLGQYDLAHFRMLMDILELDVFRTPLPELEPFVRNCSHITLGHIPGTGQCVFKEFTIGSQNDLEHASREIVNCALLTRKGDLLTRPLGVFITEHPSKVIYLVLERAETSLFDIFNKTRKSCKPAVLVTDALKHAQRIAEGMLHLHTCNVLHRDLKAGNVFVRTHMLKL
eukprot:TRINITY_DN10257_c0_g2_i2.p1 TRINITY_DN10257_c0_g2~~TRINITY_DN10257_c0_g2_i2.p1  ORF type:complete len:467 (+),score=35.68 TRINITY_DN10257_c0_g2_i2:46-1401(+)